ncbi:MAG: hypothetical protein ETSY1_00155 [Candidatus Entotheonella factor]|uniref:MbtH-like domain-containing protein n=1 Tax=Entotheonella factor TaxID=1429438 RepID=W4M164_ENTF1|nr:MAG: hypothetical protein ETSY1_00155 [Candidatus Entotheonella factor]
MAEIDEQEDTTIYNVVINHEEQYSIWPADRDNPPGWQEVGKRGLKQECLDYIEEVWTDMRPLSLRRQMEEAAQRPAPPPPPSEAPITDDSRTGDPLVDRLSEGKHAVEAGLASDKTAQAFQARLDRDYVHIKFTQTQGGTELGVRLDRERSDWREADFVSATGTVHIEGDLTLNDVRVRCVADIDLATLSGQGHLEPL